MADEIFKPDANFKAGGLVGGVSSAEDGAKLVLRINPTTKRLLVDASITAGFGSQDGITDGQAVDVATLGVLVLGSDGANYQAITTDSSGRILLGATTNAIGKLAANDGVDIGDVTINNAVGAGVYIRPGSGINLDTSNVIVTTLPNVTVTSMPTVTVTATNLDIRDIDAAADDITVYGSQAVALQQKVTSNDLIVTLDGETVAIASIAAGDNNIGNVDLVSLPAGNLGMQVMTSSLSIVPASNITDATYIGDIKFGESLPAGTAAIGKLASNTGVDIGDVDVTSIVPLTGATNLGKARDGAVGATDTGVAILAVRDDALSAITPAEGDYDVLKLDANGALWVNLATKLDSTNDSIAVVGNVAHDAADSGNPVKLGLKAIAHGTNPTAVAANDRTDWYANRAGVPFVMGGHPNLVTIEAAYTSAQTDTAIVTVAGGLKIVVTQIQLTCDNANTVNTGARVGLAGTNTPTTTGVVITHPGIAPGSGISRGDGDGILGIGADGEDLRITSEVPTGGSLRVLVSYYTIES